MVWPTANLPTYGRGVWLECNGQSFSTTQFPQLYETLGTNRVPNYQGMFLRGYGSQSYNQDNGDAPSNTTYASGNIGQIQGDAMRKMYTHFGGQQWGGTFESVVSLDYHEGVFKLEPNINTGTASFPKILGDPRNMPVTSGPFDVDAGWYNALTKWKYTMSCSSSDDGEGHSSTSCELNEEEIHPDLAFYNSATELIFDNSLQMMVSNEIRPVNVAVKFMIKAK